MGNAREFCFRILRASRGSSRRVGWALRRSVHSRTWRGTDCKNYVVILVDIPSSSNLLSLGSVHSCSPCQVDTAQRAFEDGCICLRWGTVWNSDINATIRFELPPSAFPDYFHSFPAFQGFWQRTASDFPMAGLQFSTFSVRLALSGAFSFCGHVTKIHNRMIQSMKMSANILYINCGARRK